MLSFRLKQKKLEDFRNQKKNSLGVTTNFMNWYLKEWKRRNLQKTKNKTKVSKNKDQQFDAALQRNFQ